MAIEYQNKSEVSVGTNQTSITIPVPTGFSAGDLLIACVVIDGSGTINIPAGWTLIQGGDPEVGCHFNVSYRIAEVGDTEWTWTYGLAEQWYGVILRYKGQALSGFIHASDIALHTGSNTPTAPDVAYTDLEEGSLCLQVFGSDEDYTYTTPVQLTERYNGISNTGTGTVGGAGGDKVISGTGSTGTAVFTMSGSDQWVAVTVVIEAQAPPITHEIAGVINGVAIIDGETTVIGTYIYPFTTDDGKWTLSNSTISGGVLDITTAGGYGQRSPDANWYSGSANDFILEFDFKQDSIPATEGILNYLYLIGDAKPVQFNFQKTRNAMEIVYDAVVRATQSYTQDTSWHTAKIRRVGTTYYFSVDSGDEISWDYGTARAFNYIRLYMFNCTGEFDNFKYSWMEIGGIHFIKTIVNGISTISGDLKGTFFIAGDIDAVSQISGKLVGVILIDGQIQALSEINGQIIVGKYISGNINAISQVSGNLTGIFYLIGEVQGVSSITGLPHIIRILKGTIAGQSVIIGILQDADKWSKPDRETSQFSKTSRDASAFGKTARDTSTWTKEDR